MSLASKRTKGAKMPVGLSPDNRRKLAGVLGMLGKSCRRTDAAAHLANRIVRGAGLTWGALMAVSWPVTA